MGAFCTGCGETCRWACISCDGHGNACTGGGDGCRDKLVLDEAPWGLIGEGDLGRDRSNTEFALRVGTAEFGVCGSARTGATEPAELGSPSMAGNSVNSKVHISSTMSAIVERT
jgi:hypothetical protein